MSSLPFEKLAIPGVLLLISFLSFSSQYLFSRIEPEDLTTNQKFVFNALIAGLLICYTRCCVLNPGSVPPGWSSHKSYDAPKDEDSGSKSWDAKARGRWCRKCDAAKPPRAHHCRTCKRCIPKMDHHCVWISNCVSHRIFPHFLRFLFFAVAAMSYLTYFIYLRLAHLWINRNLPSVSPGTEGCCLCRGFLTCFRGKYRGPSVLQLSHLFVLTVVNSLTLFALTILFFKSVWSLGSNVYTIEGWEIERHHTLLRRARVLGGYLSGPNGVQIKIKRQEFPFDIGIWSNIVQGMGTKNVLGWFWPFASSLPIYSGIEFEENGFEDPDKTWPPPDPDRIPMDSARLQKNEEMMDQTPDFSNQKQLEAFRMRQERDAARWNGTRRRKPFVQRLEAYKHSEPMDMDSDITDKEDYSDYSDGEEGWKNSEGERLADFGVDQDIEFYDEDDLPLAELAARRKFAE